MRADSIWLDLMRGDSVLLSSLGDPSNQNRPTRPQVVAALQAEIDRCSGHLRDPGASEACIRAYRAQKLAAQRLLGAVQPEQGRLL